MEKILADLILKNCSQVLTCKEHSPDLIGIMENTCLAIKGEKIVFIGKEHELESNVDYSNARIINGKGKVVAPGFVDSHTHLVFGGSRVEEYIARLTINDTKTLEEMGIPIGIYVSVERTKETTIDLLVINSLKKLNKMLLSGTTTVEIKSGYGLDIDTELKQLTVNQKIQELTPLDIYSTFLGAHGWPQEMSKSKYIDFLINESIPAVAESGVAQFCDIWCDDGYYTAAESEKILQAGGDYGLIPRMHTDCYSYIGGSDLAAEMKMASADHLNYLPRNVMKKLADAKVPGVVLPGTDFSVNHPKPFDPRPMLEEGMILALASNLNPGNWVESMQFIMALACRKHRMTPEEAIIGSTLNGAKVLGIDNDRGSIEVGKLADLQIWDTDIYQDVVYKLGGNLVETVIKRGKIVVENKLL